jgi:hypothetical protein
MPNAALTTEITVELAWTASHKVSRRPSHRATVPEVSIAW